MSQPKKDHRSPSPRSNTTTPSPGAAANMTWRREGLHLFNQQLWCWGRDAALAGNLLVRYGFKRQERPAGVEGSSIYRFDSAPGQRIILRGFGAFIGDNRWGGLFLKRFDFSPMIRPEPDLSVPIWHADHLPEFSPPADLVALRNCNRLLSDLIDWICSYERWVRRYVGASYRREIVDQWVQMRKGSPTPSHLMTRKWQRLRVPLLQRAVSLAA